MIQTRTLFALGALCALGAVNAVIAAPQIAPTLPRHHLSKLNWDCNIDGCSPGSWCAADKSCKHHTTCHAEQTQVSAGDKYSDTVCRWIAHSGVPCKYIGCHHSLAPQAGQQEKLVKVVHRQAEAPEFKFHHCNHHAEGDGCNCRCHLGSRETEHANAGFHHSTTPALDGGWSMFSSFGRCHSECNEFTDNNGWKSKYRTCTNPKPANGGAWCSGADWESVACIDPACKRWTCSCLNGVAAKFPACTTQGANMCASCDAGHFLDGVNCKAFTECADGQYEATAPIQTTQNRVCKFYAGSCANGKLTSQANRRQHNHCGSCYDGYYLSSRQCLAYGGSCANGKLTSQANRRQHNHCGSCYDGYYLSSRQCHAYGGSCANGKLASQANRRQHNHCGSCNGGYYLSGRQCYASPTPAPPTPAPYARRRRYVAPAPTPSCISCATPLAPWTDKLDLGFNTAMTCFTATEQPSELCATDASILVQTTAGWATMETLAVGTQTTKFGRVIAVTRKSQPACSFIFDSVKHGITDRDFAKWCPDFSWDSQTIGGVDGILQAMRNDHADKDVLHNLLRGNDKMYAAAREVCDMLTTCSSAAGSKRACIDTKFAGLSKRMQAYQANLGLSSAAAASADRHALAGLEKLV